MITEEKDFNKLRELVKKEKKIKIYSSDDDEINRKVIEKLPVEILLINLENRKDFLKQRNSGFNQVLAKIAKKKKVKIGINLDEIIESKEQNRVIARLKQNISICKKEKLEMQFVQKKYKRETHELKSLLASLKAPTWMVSKLQEIRI
jgi:RNase P/RNase MRP subunit p30